jgi:hypothetical protein
LTGVVLLYCEIAAPHNTGEARQIGQRRVKNVAAYIVEVDVDTIGTMLAQRFAHVFALVVVCRVVLVER